MNKHLTTIKLYLKRHVGKGKSYLKSTFAKKRNQRKAIIIGLGIACLSLFIGLLIAINQTIQANDVLYQRKVKLQSLTEQLQDVKQQKTTTEAQLQEKAANEARLQQHINELNAQLQAKREAGIASATKPKLATAQFKFFSSGNDYFKCQCTWYAKSKRPDLPNNLGNANTWVSRARAQGIPTGSTPRVGAIGQRGMHVVYIERVNSDGTVYLSELNYNYRCGFRYRIAPASYFYYIYR